MKPVDVQRKRAGQKEWSAATIASWYPRSFPCKEKGAGCVGYPQQTWVSMPLPLQYPPSQIKSHPIVLQGATFSVSARHGRWDSPELQSGARGGSFEG